LGKIGLLSATTPKTVGDVSVGEECRDSTRDGEKVSHSVSAVVPTLEEKTVVEHRPLKLQTDGVPIGDFLQEQDFQGKSNGVSKTEVIDYPSPACVQGGELFDAPADASKSPKTDDQPPHAPSGINNEGEQATPRSRSILRKHLGSKIWTLHTPKPHIDPHSFEDPISDAFWKNVWLASAVHNVCFSNLSEVDVADVSLDRDISQGIPCHTGRSSHYVEAVQGIYCTS
jgi:phospholipase D1/2